MSKIIDHEQASEKAFWLLRNTALTFHQIADFCGLNPLEVANIENTEHSHNKTGFNPVMYQEITQEDITTCEQDPAARLPKDNIIQNKKRRRKKIAATE